MDNAIAQNVSFEYDVVSIKDLEVMSKGGEPKANRQSLPIQVNGRDMTTTPRFWTSLYSRYGFNGQFQKFFSHAEIFDRIHAVEKNDKIRICIEMNTEEKNGRLLAVSNPNKPVARYEDVVGLLKEYDGQGLAYHNGELTSLHAPRIGGSSLIGGDMFENRFSVAVPIDGYGQTSLYLAMLRQVCENGAIAMSKAFKSTLQLGKGDDSVMPTLVRALDSYNNDEGFHALRQRIESSTKSWASVYEANQLHKQLIKMHLGDELTSDGPAKSADGVVLDERFSSDGWSSPVMNRFHKMIGDMSALYGFANTDALGLRKQKTLPVRCTVYDLINFATEVSSHHSNAGGQRRLAGWFGSAISNEYDLEGTVESMPNFQDLFIGKKLANGLTGSV